MITEHKENILYMKTPGMIDVHSHLAWGIDDGIQTREDAQTALELAKSDGIFAIISTPHFISGTSGPEFISIAKNRQADLQELASQYGIQIFSGAEMFMNPDFPDNLRNGAFITLNGTRYLLAEFDVRRDIHTVDARDEWLYEIEGYGMIPVVAHVERYFHNGLDMDIIDEWRERGYVLQVNRSSIIDTHGSKAHDAVMELIRAGKVHMAGCDAHRPEGRRIEKLSDAYEIVAEEIGRENADLLFWKNAAHVLRGEPVEELKVEAPKKKRGWFGRR